MWFLDQLHLNFDTFGHFKRWKFRNCKKGTDSVWLVIDLIICKVFFVAAVNKMVILIDDAVLSGWVSDSKSIFI